MSKSGGNAKKSPYGIYRLAQKTSNSIKVEQYLLGCLVAFSLLSGTILSSTATKADDTNSIADDVAITVPSSCTMVGDGTTTHSDTINNGATKPDIGVTTINIYCNDDAGFSIYAIGYTGDTPGNNKLVGTNASDEISTGTATGGNNPSSWAVKLAIPTTPTPTYPAIIAGSASDTEKQSGDPDYTTYQAVPSTYSRVAYRATSTDIGTNAEGSTFTTTYQVFISNTQPAGTYQGKVKYVLVHPNTAPTPIVPPAPQASCNTPFPASTGITYMQEINSTNKTTVLAALTQDQHYYLRDSRDEEPYCVVKLADGNLWLADNLRLDLTNSTTLAGMNETNTNASNTTLGYLKGDTTRDPNTDASGQYATSAVSDWSTNPTFGSNFSYSDPLVDTASKDSVNSSDLLSDNAKTWKYGIYYNYCAASAGSYCYGNGMSAGTSVDNATEDICPKNWRMSTSNTGGEYATLYSNSNYNTVATLRSALRLPLSGNFGNGSAASQGSYGRFWSSTRNVDSNMYYLSVSTSNVSPSNRGGRSSGYSVRCVLSS